MVPGLFSRDTCGFWGKHGCAQCAWPRRRDRLHPRSLERPGAPRCLSLAQTPLLSFFPTLLPLLVPGFRLWLPGASSSARGPAFYSGWNQRPLVSQGTGPSWSCLPASALHSKSSPAAEELLPPSPNTEGKRHSNTSPDPGWRWPPRSGEGGWGSVPFRGTVGAQLLLAGGEVPVRTSPVLWPPAALVGALPPCQSAPDAGLRLNLSFGPHWAREGKAGKPGPRLSQEELGLPCVAGPAEAGRPSDTESQGPALPALTPRALPPTSLTCRTKRPS